MKKEDLAAAVEFVVDDALDFFFVEEYDFCLDGDAVWRRGVDDAQVTGSEQRELKGSRDRSGREGKGIYGCFQFPEFLFCTYAEFLFFVYDKKAQVFETEVFGEDFVGTDEDVNLAVFEVFLDTADFLGGTQAADVVNVAGKVFQTGLECVVVLKSQDGCWHKHSYLLAVGGCLEGCPDGNFRFSEAYVAAHQAVHRAIVLHICLDGFCCQFLVRSVFIYEGGFEFSLEVCVRRICETF